MDNIIDEQIINGLLEQSKNPSRNEVLKIIQEAKDCQGLSLEETAKLLQVEDEDLLEDIFAAAKLVKEKIYGKRVVLFAPLYTSNKCSNNCLYCGFRVENKLLHRRTLTINEIVAEAKKIEEQGHKRILMVCGEDPRETDIDHITEALRTIYSSIDIRRINVNAAPMEVEDFKKLKGAGIGTYQLFQETYHRSTYKRMHPSGPKADYDYRLTALDRAFEAGIDDLGIGVLLGLYDYKFDVLAALMHANYLDDNYGAGPHTISVPRLRPALGSALNELPYAVSDKDFKKIVAVYRLAVPYTGIILSTRENPKLRDQLLDLGVSQVSAGSRTNPGGYVEDDEEAGQFITDDERSLDEIIQVICESGYIPSFCTACYRRSRTGEQFMELAKTGHIHEFCQSNAIITFKENLLDYASESTKKKGEELIKKALNEIDSPQLRKKTEDKLKKIEEGKRDLYF